MHLFFLEADVPLTKSYKLDSASGEVLKTPYPMTWEFTSHQVEVGSLFEFDAALRRHAARGHCLIKGLLHKDLNRESRAGATGTNDQTEWLCLDFDRLPKTVNVTDQRTGVQTSATLTVDTVLDLLGLKDYSYIVQWSASYGVTDDALRCHIFILLDRAYSAPLIKQWLIQLNHSVSLLREEMKLTKTGNAISWPLDISACQNDKLIYIAKPNFVGMADPLNRRPRIALVKGKHERFTLPLVNSSEQNRELTNRRLNELREAANLPKRKVSYRMHGTTEVMAKPDAAVITEMKTERGFVYFNLNGGDSWAYYHPESNPDYIYNFKGEPTYLTKELLPDYWQEITSSGSKANSTGLMHLAFCDRKTGGYWRGSYDSTVDELDLYPAKNETQVRHFAKQVGLPLGDFIPEMDLVFDPHDNVRVDLKNKSINFFSPSPYMRAVAKKVTTIPPTIDKVITHALGSTKAKDRFINWLAFIVQKRDMTKTAWVLHGVPGTGKGILLNKILRPMLGQRHVTMRRMEELAETFNGYIQQALIVFVDEVQTKALMNERGVMARLKNFLTEPFVVIRHMYSAGTEMRNYSNWIFASNMPDPVLIEKNDRRFNVGTYQAAKLQITNPEIDQLESELQSFHDYLLYFQLDENAAQTVFQSSDRDLLISVSESSVDTIAGALLDGDMGFLIEQLPTDNSHESARDRRYDKVEEYKAVLRRLLARTVPAGHCVIGREELRTIFDYCVGGMPDGPNKFTSLLKHHRMHMSVVWIDGKAVRGTKLTFTDYGNWAKYRAAVDPPVVKKPQAVANGMIKRIK